jgi:hypothetical protein
MFHPLPEIGEPHKQRCYRVDVSVADWLPMRSLVSELTE